MMGKISDLDENFIKLEIAEGTTVKFRRSAVSAVMPKGTLKEL
jgi:preprotein translocase subunit YajC